MKGAIGFAEHMGAVGKMGFRQGAAFLCYDTLQRGICKGRIAKKMSDVGLQRTLGVRAAVRGGLEARLCCLAEADVR